EPSLSLVRTSWNLEVFRAPSRPPWIPRGLVPPGSLELELAEVFRVEPFEVAAELLGLLFLGQLARLGLGLAFGLRFARRGLFARRRLEQRLVHVDRRLGTQRERDGIRRPGVDRQHLRVALQEDAGEEGVLPEIRDHDLGDL